MKPKSPELTVERETVILNAAQRRFMTYGYSKVTMDEIAEDIGMGKASLYYYFPTKDDIFRGVIQREQGGFVSQMREMLKKNLTASEKLRTYFRLRTNYSDQLFSLSWHNRQLWPSMKPIFKDLFANLALEEEKTLTHLLREGKQGREFCVPSPDKTARLIMHVLQGLRIRLFHLDQAVQSSEVLKLELEKETTMFIEALLFGITSRDGAPCSGKE